MTKIITLATAQKLKKTCDKFGVEMPESELVHFDKHTVGLTPRANIAYLGVQDPIAPAYDTNELFEWIPCKIDKDKMLSINKHRIGYEAIYQDLGNEDIWSEDICETPQEALANLLIYLISKGLDEMTYIEILEDGSMVSSTHTKRMKKTERDKLEIRIRRLREDIWNHWTLHIILFGIIIYLLK